MRPPTSSGPVAERPAPARIRPARCDDLAILLSIERAAGRLFDPWRERLAFHEDEPSDEADLEQVRARGDLLVAVDAADEPIGFCILGEIDGNGHLLELDVHPDHGRRGVGRRLVEFAAETMRARGYAALTLTTFREVPWNRPFYESAGFVVVEAEGPEMRRVLELEEAAGLDVSRRCVMRREL